MIYSRLSLKGSRSIGAWPIPGAYARNMGLLAEYFAESGIDSQIEIDAASLLAGLAINRGFRLWVKKVFFEI